MTNVKTYREAREELESLIDDRSVTEVLELVAQVCHMKAEHVRTNWQDLLTAQVWDDAAELVHKTAGKPEFRRL